MYNLDIKDTDVIIIPEQHLYYKSLGTAPTTLQDNRDIIRKIYSKIDTLVNPTVLFVGDIFHRGIPSTENTYELLDYIRTLYQKTQGRVFSVVGNHELTYRRDNIFWGMADIRSEYLKVLNVKQISLATKQIIVPDELVIGNMQYSFMHYNRVYPSIFDVAPDVDAITVLSHNSILNSDISTLLKSQGQNLHEAFINVSSLHDAGVIPPTNKVKYMYVGHMHTAHGNFKVEKEYIQGVCHNFKLRYLASLGRTNHSEFTDDILRQLPIHVIRNGVFEREDIFEIELPKRVVSVDESLVSAQKESYERSKEYRELKSVESHNVDLIDSILEYLHDKPKLNELFARADTPDLDPLTLALVNKYSMR